MHTKLGYVILCPVCYPAYMHSKMVQFSDVSSHHSRYITYTCSFDSSDGVDYGDDICGLWFGVIGDGLMRAV